MKRRTKWLTVSAIGLGVVVAYFIISGPRQPTYQQRDLDAWLADLTSSNYQTQQLARAAIREMGPRAVPFLTNSLAQRDSLAIRAKRQNLVPRRIVNWARKVVKWRSPMIESRNAAVALQALGQDATNAIPALIVALSDPSPIIAQAAAVALGSMDAAAVPALRDRLNVAAPNEIPWVLQAVSALGTNAAPLAPELGRILENAPNSGMAGWVEATFAKIGPEAVPAIEKVMQNTNREVVLRGLSALANLGQSGIAATNILFELSRSEDAEIRLRARQAFGATLPPRELGLPVWVAGMRDPYPKNVEVSLRFLAIHPASVRQYSNEIAGLASHPTISIREVASNALTRFHAWPR
ncbi:MAG TPA: hypothetical protein VM680_11090 [Verrucomicrobiae bacterium]|nr:hypothetical protein [Verrucomicrobiae bacterium]